MLLLVCDRSPLLVIIPFSVVDDKDLVERVAQLLEHTCWRVKPTLLGKSFGFIYFMERKDLGVAVCPVKIRGDVRVECLLIDIFDLIPFEMAVHGKDSGVEDVALVAVGVDDIHLDTIRTADERTFCDG